MYQGSASGSSGRSSYDKTYPMPDSYQAQSPQQQEPAKPTPSPPQARASPQRLPSIEGELGGGACRPCGSVVVDMESSWTYAHLDLTVFQV